MGVDEIDILITAFNRIDYDYGDVGDNPLYSPEEDIYLFNIKELVFQMYEDPMADGQKTYYRLSTRIPIDDRVIICHNYFSSKEECINYKYGLQVNMRGSKEKNEFFVINCGTVIIKKVETAKIEL